MPAAPANRRPFVLVIVGLAVLVIVAIVLLSAGGLDGYYQAVRARLGEAFSPSSHQPWRDGYADLERIETQVATSRARRYFRVSDDRGYVLACEARDDVFHRVARWCDMIASTLAVGPEVAPQ